MQLGRAGLELLSSLIGKRELPNSFRLDILDDRLRDGPALVPCAYP